MISARVESELKQMPPEEAKEWLEMLGVTDGGLANLIRATYKARGVEPFDSINTRALNPDLDKRRLG